MAAADSQASSTRIEIGDRPINLTQVLNRAGWVQHGGEAKALITNGQVLVNDEVELRKRRKMVVGDRVAILDGPCLILA